MRILVVVASAIMLIGGLVAAALLAKAGAHLGWAASAVIAGIGGFVWLSRFDDWLKQKIESGRVAHADERFTQLMAAARAHDFELKVKGASNLWIALLVLAMGGMAVYSETDWIYRVVAWGIAIPSGILVLLMAIPQIGKPAITLTRSGFKTATSPDIPWRLVDGVHYSERLLSSNDSEAAPVGTLTFSVPTLSQEATRFSLLLRLLHGLPGQRSRARIIVTLRKTSEPPSAVGRLAEHLWMQSTGRTNDWNPNMSKAYNAANRELAELIAAQKNRPANTELDLEDLKAQVQKAERNSKIISHELDRKSRELKLAVWIPVWILIMVAVFMLVFSLR